MARGWGGRQIGALIGVCAVALTTGAFSSSVAHPTVPPAAPSALNPHAEHRYRIIGKLRLGLFSIGRDDVGSGRMTWRSDGGISSLTLLVGSDPLRAPRNLNQWGYLREEVGASDEAQVFSVRSLDTGEVTPDSGFGLGDGPMFGVSCASFTDRDVSSAQTTVNARGVTYRMFNELLDRVGSGAQWKERRIHRPAGADAGFLSALQHAIRQAGESAVKSPPPVSYVYNNTIYDLNTRDNRMIGRVSVGARTFEHLARTNLSIRNRTTGEVTKFAVTHAVDSSGMSLPVQIFYQPTFWLSVELRLDDGVDVPTDPDTDGSMLKRIHAICASSAH